MTAPATPDLYYLGDGELLAGVRAIAAQLAGSGWIPDFVVGIGRGGLVPAVYLSHLLARPMLSIDHSAKVPGFADDLLVHVAASSAAGTRLLVVDDINDSGATIRDIRDRLTAHGGDGANLRFAVVVTNVRSQADVDYAAQTIDRRADKRWFVFPWEAVGALATIEDEARSVPGRLA